MAEMQNFQRLYALGTLPHMHDFGPCPLLVLLLESIKRSFLTRFLGNGYRYRHHLSAFVAILGSL